MTGQSSTPSDPRQSTRSKNFAPEKQPYPGEESKMDPVPDFGEATYRGSGKLKDKVALITGGDSGIGRAVALAYAREGADVVVSYLSEHEDAEETKRAVQDSGRRCVVIEGDIQEHRHCSALVDKTIEAFGRLDVLVNNAAFQMSHPSFEELSPDEIDRTFRTNIFAMFYTSQAAVKCMKPGSAIINVASIQAYQPSAHILAYAVTKGAIVTFTKGLSQELAKKGIRVNAVAPGPVWTPLIVSTMPEEKIKTFGQKTPLGRAAQPSEVAPSFVFLACDDSSYITGETIAVTGGEITA